jgi:hypothetical protein
MGRYTGTSAFRVSGQDSQASIAVKSGTYTRVSGMTTDGANNVTAVTLGPVAYSSITYNANGLITGYTETINNIPKTFTVTYDGTNNNVTAITEV